MLTTAPHLLNPSALLRPSGDALPAELQPYAAAQLLPLLLLSPERVRAMDVSGLEVVVGTDLVSVILRDRVVRPQPPALRPFEAAAALRATPRSDARARACRDAGRNQRARGRRQPRGVQSGRAGVPGPGALCRGGADRAGRALCARPRRGACPCQGAGGLVCCGGSLGSLADQQARCACLRSQPARRCSLLLWSMHGQGAPTELLQACGAHAWLHEPARQQRERSHADGACGPGAGAQAGRRQARALRAAGMAHAAARCTRRGPHMRRRRSRACWPASPSWPARRARWPARLRAPARWAPRRAWRGAFWARTRRPSAGGARPARWVACSG